MLFKPGRAGFCCHAAAAETRTRLWIFQNRKHGTGIGTGTDVAVQISAQKPRPNALLPSHSTRERALIFDYEPTHDRISLPLGLKVSVVRPLQLEWTLTPVYATLQPGPSRHGSSPDLQADQNVATEQPFIWTDVGQCRNTMQVPPWTPAAGGKAPQPSISRTPEAAGPQKRTLISFPGTQWAAERPCTPRKMVVDLGHRPPYPGTYARTLSTDTYLPM